MGAGRRTGFVRSSDEEDEGSGGLTGADGAGPSSSRVPQKRSKRSISHAGLGAQNSAGKTKEYKRLKHTVKSKITDLENDSDEEDYELEDITASVSRHKKSRRKEDRGFTKKNGTAISPCKKRKQSFFPAQKPYSSKAGGIYFEETEEESSQKQTADAVEPPIGKEFEQYLLEEVFTISKDTYTKEADLPERFQSHEQFVSAYVSKGDWSKEAYWIYDRAFGNPTITSDEEELKVIADIDKEEIVPEIIFVLVQLHVQKCEIPFIGMYNFHGCMHLAGRSGSSNTYFNFEENNLQLRSFKALWSIFHLDRKWLLLQHHIDKQQESWKKRTVIEESACVTKDRTLDILVQALQDAESEPVVDDLVAKFDLLFPTDEEAQPKGPYKRPRRQSYYDICCKSGLRQLVKQLGLTPEQLGENLQAKEKIHEAPDCDAPPEGVDLSSASGQFSEVHRALAGARHMAAHEISCEPRVRNYVRSLFTEHAVLSTRPTAKGNSLIDSFHEFSCVKYVQGKPVKRLDDGEWLLMQRAEEEQLIEVTTELTGEILDGEVMQGLRDLYFSNASNEVAVLWNEQRNLTVQEAVSKIMLPIFVKEMRMSLTAKAKAWVQAECGKVLWKRVSVAPYIAADGSPDAYQSSKATSDYTNARVLACCWGFRNPPTTFVMLDAFGELVDTLQTGYLNVHSGSLDQQLQRKIDDQERLQKFMVKHQPHVVVVGATVHYACRQLKDTIIETVSMAAELNTSLSSVPVIFGDESLPLLCEKSQLSNMQLPKHPSIIKRAIALGRSLQNPLALISSLCNPSKDIVALNLHPMQQFLSTEELYSAIEQVMITITNQVGVDVNLAVAHEWLFSPLQFICGLGWKKASILQQLIQELRWLPSRGHLLKHPFLLKDVVFRNCSGFLRIRRVAHAVSGLRKLNPLDDTRIHPDSYELAQSLANHALSKGEGLLGSEADLEMAETAIAYIQKNPDILSEATVMDFFSSLAELEQLNIETLKDIRSELLCGFRDYRAPYTQPTQDEEFSWLTGEDDYSLATGKPVNVSVHKVFRHRVMCILQSGTRGVLEKENFTSDSSVDLATIFSEGSTLTCYIADVKKDQFLVNLTCKEAEDHNSDASSAQERLSSEKASEKLGPKDYLFKPRDVCHSHFDNVSVSDAIKALSDKNPGEAIFHPSSRGPACLSMTLKCHNDVYLRKEIEELNKDSTNLATFSKLGRILKIDGRSFQNLDEVVTSYASPLLGKTNEVLQSKEFQFGSDSEIKSFLQQEKGVSSESLVYCFSMRPDNPGAIAVSYVLDGNIKQETIELYPEGYGFQGKMFRKVDTLITYLKKAVLAASYDPQMWGGRGETCDGTGRGGGRGGRFGSGRRGRGRGGRGGRGNGSRGKWGDESKDGIDGFGDAQENAQEGGTFSGGWGDKDDWSHSQNNNRGNNRGHGERGNFRGRRGRGRGYGRGGEGAQWGQAHNKSEENFWSGGTSGNENTDPLKAPDTGAGNSSWDAGNAGSDGWGTGNDGWASTDGHVEEHNKKAEKDLSTWGAECNTRDFSEEKGNERVQNGNAGKHRQDDKLNGIEGWGMTSEPLVTGFKDPENAKEMHDGWDAVDIQASKSGGNAGNDGWGTGNDGWESKSGGIAGNDGWGTGNDGWESTGCQTNEHRKKNEKDLSSWRPEHNGKNASEEEGSCGVQDGNAEKDFQGSKPNGLEGWGKTSKPLGTAAKAVEVAKDSFDGWHTVEKSVLQATRSADKAEDTGWGTGNDGWGSMDCPGDELKKNEKDLSSWGAEHKSLEERGNGWAQDGDRNCGALLGKGPSVGGWGDEDSRQKHRDGGMGWGAEKGQSNNGGLLGKTPTDDGWGKLPLGGRDGNDSHEKNAKDDMGWGTQKGQNNGGGLLGKAPTVGGWGESAADGWGDDGSKEKDRSSYLLGKTPTDDGWGKLSTGGWDGNDSHGKHAKDDMGWGAQKGQNNGGSLLGKAPTVGGWGESAADGWGDDGSKEKDRSSDIGWGVQKEQHKGGWGGSDGLEEKWSQDDNQRQTQSSAEGFNGRGSFRGGRGRSRGMGSGGRGRESQGEGGMGRGGRGRWSEGEDGMGRGNRGRWSQGEDGICRGNRGRWSQGESMGRGNRGRWSENEGGARGGRGGWQQSRGDGAGRRGRGGRGRWNDADGMGRCGRGRWAHKQGENAIENNWSGDGWNRESKAGKATATDANDWWASGGQQDTAQKERGHGNCWSSKDSASKEEAGTGWDGWATGSCEVETGGWGNTFNNTGKTTKETPAQNFKDGGNVGWGNTLDTIGKTTKETPAGTAWEGWATSSSDIETVGWGDTLKNSGKTTKETPAQNRKKGATVGFGDTLNNSGRTTEETPAGTGWDGWSASSSEVEPVGWGDTLINSGKTTKEALAQNRKDGATVGWGGTFDNIGKAIKKTPAQNHEDGGESGCGTSRQRGECANNGSSNIGVTTEKSSDLGAHYDGWKSSSNTGHANGCVDVLRGWDAHVQRHVSHSGNSAQKEWSDSVHMHTERREWAEPPTQETAPMESESGFKEFNGKEGTEESGDGIWGACEDLIDSNKMEGLISRKAPFDNVFEPLNMNDALQVQEAVSEGLGDADHDGSDNLAVSILEDKSSDKNNLTVGGVVG